MRVLKCIVACTVTVVLLGGCGTEESAQPVVDRDTLTRRQRDSMIGKSSLPGAHGVTGALGAADSAAARAARLEAAGQP